MCDAKEKGLLAVSGGILDQSASLFKAMEVFENDVAKIQQEDISG
jgi:ABC-type transporter Mla maintaining outer membrane lipid asymmetry ATPase subunit MlaF